MIGVRQGREAGKKDAKPRKTRVASASTNHKKILAAMRDIDREPIYRKAVAQRLNISAPTLKALLDEIREATGEEWDDMVGKALRMKVKK